MKRNILQIILVISLGLVIMTACEVNIDDDDDDDDDDSLDQCNIYADNLVEVLGNTVDTNCGTLGLVLLLDNVFTNPAMTVFKITGQFSISNDNTYFLKGKGVSEDKVCFDQIQNTGTYEIWTEFSVCTSSFIIDVVTSTDPGVVSFCTIDFEMENGCDDDDDDDDGGVDDDDDDNDDFGSPPEIDNASWSPDPAEYDPVEDFWISTTTFYICDVDDDLSGGNIYFLQAGTNDSAWTVPYFSWDDFFVSYTLGDVTDCADKAEVAIGTIFGTGTTPPGPATTCIDIEVSDGQANFSNKLTNLCVDVPGP